MKDIMSLLDRPKIREFIKQPKKVKSAVIFDFEPNWSETILEEILKWHCGGDFDIGNYDEGLHGEVVEEALAKLGMILDMEKSDIKRKYWHDIGRSDKNMILNIVVRAAHRLPKIDRDNLAENLSAVHSANCRLRLEDLFGASDIDFFQDIFGIMKNINKDTGKLENLFLPQYAAHESGAGA